MENEEVTLGDLAKLRHMLGIRADLPRSEWGWRNHFVAGDGDVPAMERLAAAGLVVRREVHDELVGGGLLYVATETGKERAYASMREGD